MRDGSSPNLALLIDADNAQASAIEKVLSESARYGTVTIRRAYGDWTTPNLGSWKETLHVHAVQPIQQFRYTTGKNATDSALIIDAMDILHSGKVAGFCLVSSDSDFTRLATRIRESGFAAYGFGEKKTPQPSVAACDKFIYTEILGKGDTKANASGSPELEANLRAAVAAAAQDDGWASLGVVGSYLTKNDPSFDSRNFGYRKLGDLVRAQPFLDVDERKAADDSPIIHIFVRSKEA